MKKDYHKKKYVEVKARTIQREIRRANVPAFNKQWWSKLSLFSLPNLQVFHCSLSSHHTKTKTQKTPSESWVFLKKNASVFDYVSLLHESDGWQTKGKNPIKCLWRSPEEMQHHSLKDISWFFDLDPKISSLCLLGLRSCPSESHSKAWRTTLSLPSIKMPHVLCTVLWSSIISPGVFTCLMCHRF